MSTSNRFKVVIPARYGSTRLPAKPLLEINNKPIFWHVAQRVLEAGVNISDIVIATDDQRIEAKAIELKLPVAMTKSTHVSGTDRVNEVASQLNWHENTLVLNVQGDEPLMPSPLIKKLMGFSESNAHFDMFTASVGISKYEDFINANVVKAIVTENNQALYFSRSAAPVNRDDPSDLTYANRHVGIYLYSVKILQQLCELSESTLENTEKLEQLRALSNGVSIGVMKYCGEIPHGIDTEKDYLNVKAIMESI
ncbi:3-deoxy-manno-octulosonate cytidylyltransferase [Pseudoalteromonas sp. MMG007]|uniref:3-deoxy-manno-octulosonate cytidylyltransferase n=1 Tax=Pseudoalteromonas sp. MMG007 TaxID=2822684 RepID=UPI001B38475A|nr:3-deoxy-manno-octulosonate cytidylyltransferase [Pseudoalteromonas sp. MMG007]MBQ4858429.1 3-deoxy-manno-octulosonate cytidylyltransferase [Pseudoalteromonas sp. MMG007]